MPSGVYVRNPETEKIRRDKISKTMLGRLFTNEHKENLSKSRMGNKYPNNGDARRGKKYPKISEGLRNSKKAQEHRKMLHSLPIKPKTQEQIEKQRKSLTGYRHSDSTKQLHRLKALELWNNEEFCQKVKESHRRNLEDPIYREKCKESHSGFVYSSRRRFAAMNQARRLGNKRFHNTKPEKQMKEILNELAIKYIHNYPVWDIEHCYCADFFLDGKVILEVDGKHWHNYPFRTDKDRIRVKEMEEQGYKVLRFWEGEFNLDAVKEKLLELQVKLTLE